MLDIENMTTENGWKLNGQHNEIHNKRHHVDCNCKLLDRGQQFREHHACTKVDDEDHFQLHLARDESNNSPNIRDSDNYDTRLRDIDRGWAWAVLFACFGNFTFMGGDIYAVGIVHTTLLEKYEESVSRTSWAGALHMAALSTCGPIASALVDRFSCRVAIVAAGACYVIGYLATAFAPNLDVAIFTIGVVAGFGGAFGYIPSMVVVSFYFRRRRNSALGFALSGMGVGLFVMAPLMQLSRDYYGNTGFFIIMAAMSANMFTFGVICCPSTLEISAQRKRKEESKRRKSKTCSSFRNYKHVICNKAILCMCVSMFFFCGGSYISFLHLPSYMLHKGLTKSDTAMVMSISGLASIVGRFLTGLAANWKYGNDIVIYSGSILIVSIATFLFPLYSGSFSGQIVYAVLLGLFFGSCYVVMTALNIRFVGIDFMSAAIGVEFLFGGIGATIGPVIAGVIVDTGGPYDHSFIVAAFALMLAAVTGVATIYFHTDDTPGRKVIYEDDIEIVSLGHSVIK